MMISLSEKHFTLFKCGAKLESLLDFVILHQRKKDIYAVNTVQAKIISNGQEAKGKETSSKAYHLTYTTSKTSRTKV